jgi:hypothetical protein
MASNASAAIAGAAALLVALATGCGNSAKREASGLAAAVEQYRRADNAARSERAEAVVAAPCTDAVVCAAKEACLAAISPTVRALALKDQVAERLADLEARRLAPDASAAMELPRKLDDAERLLKEGHAKMQDCEKALADLRVRFGS